MYKKPHKTAQTLTLVELLVGSRYCVQCSCTMQPEFSFCASYREAGRMCWALLECLMCLVLAGAMGNVL